MRVYDRFAGAWSGRVPPTAKALVTAVTVGLLAYGLSYLASLVIARALGASVFGAYAGVTSVLTLTSAFVFLGKDVAISRFLPTYVEQKDLATCSGYLRHAIKGIAIAGAAVFVIGILVLIYLNFRTGEQLTHIKQTHPIYFFIWAVPAMMAFTYTTNYLFDIGYPNFYLVLTSAVFPILIVVGLTTFAFFFHRFSISEALIIYCCALLVTAGIAFGFSSVKTPLAKIWRTAPKYDMQRWRRVTRQLFIMAISTWYPTSLLLILMTAFSNDRQETGLVAAVLSIAGVMFASQNAIFVVAAPRLAMAIADHNPQKLRQVVLGSTCTNLLVSGLFFIMMLVWGKGWLGHFGSEFSAAYPTLVILGATVLALSGVSTIASTLEQSSLLKNYSYFSVAATLAYIVFTAVFQHMSGGRAPVYGFVLMSAASIIYLCAVAPQALRIADATPQLPPK